VLESDSVVDFSGSLVAIVTPFTDGAVDYDAFSALVAWQVEEGTNGIVVGGTTGESATITDLERESMTRGALEICSGRCPVVVGTGTNNTASSVELTRAAAEWGVGGVLAVTPYYNKPPQEGLYRHFKAMAEAAGETPVMLYDVPGRTGVTIEEATIHRLAEIDNITALKDATHDVERAGRLAKETPLTILSGDDGLTLPMMRVGATGVVSVAANVVPAAMARLCAERDTTLHEKLTPLFKALFVETNPVPLKYALASMGRIRNELRLPLVPLSAGCQAEVGNALAAARSD